VIVSVAAIGPSQSVRLSKLPILTPGEARRGMAPSAGATMSCRCVNRSSRRVCLIPAPRYFALPNSISIRVIR
jgi:hypothetical protein